MSENTQAASPRAIVEATPEGVRLSIPSRRSRVVVAFLCAWLAGWLFGEIHAVEQIAAPANAAAAEKMYGIYWLCCWTLGGLVGLVGLLWNLGGREVVVVKDGELSIRLQLFGLGFTRSYELRFVSRLRVIEKAPGASAPPPASFGDALARVDGPLAFDYRTRKTVQFGAGVDAAEAKDLLSRLLAARPALSNP